MQIDYHLKDKFDFGLIFPVIILFIIGLAAIYSSTFSNALAQGNFQKQIIWGIVALIVFFITYSVPTKTFKQLTFASYFIAIFLLIVVLLIGQRISGAKSWLAFGSFGLQPSEFAKLATILMLSRYLTSLFTILIWCLFLSMLLLW